MVGRHFPDSDPNYAGADSRVLIKEAGRRVREAGYEIGNIDATLIAQVPKMAPHIPAMISHIAADLDLEPEQVNIKAKTNERLGWEGREEGIGAEAIALIYRI